MTKQEFIEQYKNNVIKEMESLKLHKQIFEEFIEEENGDLKKMHAYLRCDRCPLFYKCPKRKWDECTKTILREVEE